MAEVITALLQLKAAFAEHEGEILNITLDKKSVDALNAECQRHCEHCCVGVCPTCGRVTDNLVLGIKIVESKDSLDSPIGGLKL